VKYLVENGADVNYEDESGKSPLYNATEEGRIDIAKYLAEKGADVNWSDGNDMTLLHLASAEGQLEVVKYLIEEKGADVNCKDKDENTPLHLAATSGRVAAAKIVADRITNIGRKDKDRMIRLMCTAQKGQMDVVRYLVEEKHADVNCQNIYGMTPLHFAAINGQLELVQFLFDHSADVNCKDEEGRTPVHLAACGDIEIVIFLAEHGGDVNCKTNNGTTPLQIAAVSDKIDNVKYLIDKSADQQGEYSRFQRC